MDTGIVSSRMVGYYPLSIATSLAVEGALGSHPDRPTHKDELNKYKSIWVNLKTLFRNLHNAIDRTKLPLVTKTEFLTAFTSEVEQFEQVIQVVTNGQMKVTFYVCDYIGMERAYPHAILRTDVTDNQKAYTALMREVLSEYVRVNHERLKTYGLKINDVVPEKTLMLTSYPLDLFSKGFQRMALLESHTGTVKEKHLWYTKYLKGKELPMIPFREDFIQIFGDQEHFHPQGIAMKRAIIEVANARHWSQVTSTMKVRYGLDEMKDRFMRDNILLFIKD